MSVTTYVPVSLAKEPAAHPVADCSPRWCSRAPACRCFSGTPWIAANMFFVHMNADVGFGMLNRVIASPKTHRIHHSRLPEHRDKNFAAVWPFWDVLFGTYARTAKGIMPPPGLHSGEPGPSPGEALMLPFRRWYRIIGSGSTRPAAAVDRQVGIGGRHGIRTHDPSVANAVLSQLS